MTSRWMVKEASPSCEHLTQGMTTTLDDLLIPGWSLRLFLDGTEPPLKVQGPKAHQWAFLSRIEATK